MLGKIEREPTKGEIGRPYCVARTSPDTLALFGTVAGSGRPGWRLEFFATVEAAGIEPGDDEPNPSESKGSSS
jgi:hypothetical protein